VVLDAGGQPAVQLTGDGAQLAGITIVNAAPHRCVSVFGANGAEVRDCHVECIDVAGGERHQVVGNVVSGGNIVLVGSAGCFVTNNYQHGLPDGAGIEVRDGRDHVIESNECRDDLCSIRVA